MRYLISFSKFCSQIQSRLYKESTHIHAAHDADLLTKVDGANTQNGLSKRVLARLQAGAFLSLCHHLRNRSDAVQNMELMSISGFCRNCLAKVGADKIALLRQYCWVSFSS